MNEKKFEMTLLFDFFGDLLTEKQREYFDLYYNEDYSLSEIAENAGISRQGVRDIIQRAEFTLREYEEKTGIVRRFNEMQSALFDLEDEVRHISEISPSKEVKDLVNKINDKLHEMKG